MLREIAEALLKSVGNIEIAKPDWVVTYPPCGLGLGTYLAEILGSRVAYLYSLDKSELYFDLRSGEKVLICADDLCSGKSLQKLLTLS